MNELKLQELLARHTTTDMDKLEFTRRINSEHLFQSVDECVEYLTKMMVFVSVNANDPKGTNMNTFKDAPVLAINTIDEAICSLIYEIYQQMNHVDQDFLAYIRNRISELQKTIIDTRYHDEFIYIQSAVYAMLMLISFLSVPVYHKQETMYSQLSYGYYKMMHTMYALAKPRDEYFEKLTKYYAEKCK